MGKERKKPPIQTTVHHQFINGQYGGKFLTKEERDEIISPLNEFEYQGEGLSETKPKEGQHPFFDVGLDVRVIHDDENVEISYAWKNTKRHKIMPFDGLTKKQACKAAGDFSKNLLRAIDSTLLMLATACVDNQLKTFEEKRKLLNDILEHTSYQYKRILKLGHYKTIEVSEKDGIKTEKSVFIDYGAKPQTAEEKEQEKRDFLTELYFALEQIRKKRIQNPKQKDLMPYMFDAHTDKEKKISEMFKKHNLSYKMMLVLFTGNHGIEDFVNNAIRTKRVTSK